MFVLDVNVVLLIAAETEVHVVDLLHHFVDGLFGLEELRGGVVAARRCHTVAVRAQRLTAQINLVSGFAGNRRIFVRHRHEGHRVGHDLAFGDDVGGGGGADVGKARFIEIGEGYGRGHHSGGVFLELERA